MTASEFAEWLSFWEFDPPRDVKHQHEAALICNVIATVNSTDKGNRPKLNDFILEYKGYEAPSKETVASKLKNYFTSIAGK